MSSIRSRHGAARLGRAASLAAAAGLGLFALAGCSTLSMDSLSLDKLNPFREREEILPGTRVDAMTEADPLTVDADANLVFDAPVAQRYDQALQLLGLQAWMLSPDIGHA